MSSSSVAKTCVVKHRTRPRVAISNDNCSVDSRPLAVNTRPPVVVEARSGNPVPISGYRGSQTALLFIVSA
jgi:hypothetical protein